MSCYSPTMNALTAASKNGRADELRKELVALFESQNAGKGLDAGEHNFISIKVVPPTTCRKFTTAAGLMILRTTFPRFRKAFPRLRTLPCG